MKKFLTTITLLCFSVAANADIYFCTEKATGLAWVDGRDSDFFNNNGPDFIGDTWIIDTDKGMRHSDDEKYAGSCESPYGVICRSFSTESGYERVFMITPTATGEEFIFTAHNRNILSVFAHAGTCTKA